MYDTFITGHMIYVLYGTKLEYILYKKNQNYKKNILNMD